jgi:hypothetical protein
LLYTIKIMMISIMYMFVALRSHVHVFDVTNMLFIIFWIKLVLNLPKFLIDCPHKLRIPGTSRSKSLSIFTHLEQASLSPKLQNAICIQVEHIDNLEVGTF